MLANTMNSEKRMNNCETEKNYICHSERAVATEESISFLLCTFNFEPLNFERFGTAKHTPHRTSFTRERCHWIYETEHTDHHVLQM